MAVEYYPSAALDRPSTRISVDSSAITGTSSGSDKLVMLVGSATGGQPNTVYKVRNYVQAKEIFRGGELLDALELAWNPSTNETGAGDILAMRVEDATAATLVKGPLTFTSKLFGTEANAIQVAYEEEEIATVTTKNLTVSFALDNYTRVYRDLGNIFTITYDGTAAYAGVEVVSGALKLYTGTDAATSTLAVSFVTGAGVYENANVLVNAINSVTGFHAVMPSSADKNIKTSGLDLLAKSAVTGSGKVITGITADIQKQLQYNPYVSVAVGSGALTEFVATNLTGGTDGAVPESWANKFPHFANEGGYYLVPVTEKPAVHAEAVAFVEERTENGDPMRVICGGDYDETADELLARAATLRNARATLVGFSSTVTLDNGTIKQIPAYLSATQVAGLASGLPIGEPITFKHVKISNLTKIFDSAQLDMLNTAGVVMTEFVRNRTETSFRLVDDVTTYNDRTDPVRNQMAIGESNDFLVSELKINLDNNFIGTRVVNVSASLLKSHIQSFLNTKKANDEIQDFDAEEIQVVINGEIASISMVVYPVRGLKRIEVSLVYKQQALTA